MAPKKKAPPKETAPVLPDDDWETLLAEEAAKNAQLFPVAPVPPPVHEAEGSDSDGDDDGKKKVCGA